MKNNSTAPYTIMVIPMLPTLFGRRYQIAKYLAKSNEVHLINWVMPYPINFRSLVYSFRYSISKKEWKQDGIIIHKVLRLPFFLPPANRWLFQKQITAICKNNGIQAIISQSFFNETEPPKILPLFFDYNDDYPAFAQVYGSNVYKLAYRLLQVNKTLDSQQKRAKAVFAVSSILETKAKKNNKHVYKIPNGVEFEALNLSHASENYGPHSLVYVTTFGKWSQVISLINVVSELVVDIPDIRLLLIGDGTELSKARALVCKLKLDKHVEIMGRINDRKRLFEIINRCEVCLNISEKNLYRDAASPIKIFEYSALGKKVVSSNLEEIENLKFQNVLVYTNDKDGANLKEAIKNAFTMEVNRDAARQLIMKEYTWNIQVKKILNIIDKALA